MTLQSKILGKGVNPKTGRVYLALHEIEVETRGHRHPYFMVTRGEEIVPHAQKKPDAVIIVGIIHDDKDPLEPRLVVTSEYRAPLFAREIGFPAGLIDPADYAGGTDIHVAAKNAAVREFKEETGLELTVKSYSPPDLYSSAGMTNESVIIVMGTATGTPTNKHNEGTEDIETLLLTQGEISKMLNNPGDKLAYSKVTWPLMWAFSKTGLVL